MTLYYHSIRVLWDITMVWTHKIRNTCINWTNNLVPVNYSATYRNSYRKYHPRFAFQCFQSERDTISKTERTEIQRTPNWGASCNFMSQWQIVIVTFQLCSVSSNLKIARHLSCSKWLGPISTMAFSGTQWGNGNK